MYNGSTNSYGVPRSGPGGVPGDEPSEVVDNLAKDPDTSQEEAQEVYDAIVYIHSILSTFEGNSEMVESRVDVVLKKAAQIFDIDENVLRSAMASDIKPVNVEELKLVIDGSRHAVETSSNVVAFPSSTGSAGHDQASSDGESPPGAAKLGDELDDEQKALEQEEASGSQEKTASDASDFQRIPQIERKMENHIRYLSDMIEKCPLSALQQAKEKARVGSTDDAARLGGSGDYTALSLMMDLIIALKGSTDKESLIRHYAQHNVVTFLKGAHLVNTLGGRGENSEYHDVGDIAYHTTEAIKLCSLRYYPREFGRQIAVHMENPNKVKLFDTGSSTADSIAA